MKRIISLLLIFAFTLLFFCSCSLFGKKNEETSLKIGYMAGPTGMGMAKLVADNGGLENGNEKYTFTKYVDTATAKADLSAGKVDIICLPTNEAAQYYAKADSSAKVLAINCLNSLFLLTSGEGKVASLNELNGQTVYTCKNGTPRMVIEHIIDELDLDINVSYEINGEVIVTPADLSSYIILGKVPNAVIPEPLVTSSLLSIAKNGDSSISYTVDIDLSSEWSKISSTPVAMGCILARGGLVDEKSDAVSAFLQEYKASVEFIGNPNNLDSAANYVVETGVMGAVPAAKKALSNLGTAIAYIDGANMKSTLVAFYEALGIALPDDDFYFV